MYPFIIAAGKHIESQGIRALKLEGLIPTHFCWIFTAYQVSYQNKQQDVLFLPGDWQINSRTDNRLYHCLVCFCFCFIQSMTTALQDSEETKEKGPVHWAKATPGREGTAAWMDRQVSTSHAELSLHLLFEEADLCVKSFSIWADSEARRSLAWRASTSQCPMGLTGYGW